MDVEDLQSWVVKWFIGMDICFENVASCGPLLKSGISFEHKVRWGFQLLS